MRDPLKLDPTRTGMIRRAFIAQLNKRYAQLARDITQVIDTEDALGLRPVPHFTFNVRWKFKTDDEKLKAFQEWLTKQIESGILSTDNTTGEPWLASFVASAYKQGVIRAYIDSRTGDTAPTKSFYEGGQAEFLRHAFTQPESITKIKLLATRTYEQLKGVTSTMAQNMNRVLAEGITKGEGPKQIARRLRKEVGLNKVRAERVARTEIIHAHAEGQLDSMEALGIDKVEALVEWITAGDNRVCPQCQDLAGVVMTLKEARGLIPRHPSCRCAWSPYLKEMSTGKRNKKDIQRALDKSLRSEHPSAKSTAAARKKSSWAGADRKVGSK